MYEEAERLIKKIDANSTQENEFVIDRSYFRLYMDQKKYKQAIIPLKELVKKENVYNRFLGFCYAKLGDTAKAYSTIDTIKKVAHPIEKSHQLAIVYAGLQKKDSVLYYLDTIRNRQTKTIIAGMKTKRPHTRSSEGLLVTEVKYPSPSSSLGHAGRRFSLFLFFFFFYFFLFYLFFNNIEKLINTL